MRRLRRQQPSGPVGSARNEQGGGEHRIADSWRGADLARGAGRVALWAFVALVLVRGLGAIFAERPEPASSREESGASVASFPDSDARAFAVRFASVYLEVSPKRPKAHQRQVAGFLTQGLSDQTVLPSHGPGMRVALATVAREVPLGGSRALITVATTSTTGTVRYVAVPVGRDQAGGLAVVGLPALVAPPPKSTATVAEPSTLAGPDAAAIRDVVGRFLSAYLTGQGVSTLRYYLAPGVRLAQMPEGLKVVSVGQLSRDRQPAGRRGGIALLASVSVKDTETGVTYPLSYRLSVTRADRWYVASVQGGPRS